MGTLHQVGEEQLQNPEGQGSRGADLRRNARHHRIPTRRRQEKRPVWGEEEVGKTVEVSKNLDGL